MCCHFLSCVMRYRRKYGNNIIKSKNKNNNNNSKDNCDSFECTDEWKEFTKNYFVYLKQSTEAHIACRGIYDQIKRFNTEDVKRWIVPEISKLDLPRRIVLLVDEFGELTHMLQEKFYSRTEKRKEKKCKEQTKRKRVSLFHPFATALISIKNGTYFIPIVMGTTLRLTNLRKGTISPFKVEEIEIIEAIAPLYWAAVQSVIQQYLGITVSKRFCERWAGRAGLLVFALIEPFLSDEFERYKHNKSKDKTQWRNRF